MNSAIYQFFWGGEFVLYHALLTIFRSLCSTFIIISVYERFNKLGICLGKTTKYTILDEIGSHFMDKVVEEVNAGKTFSFVIDNIDWDVKVHEMR